VDREIYVMPGFTTLPVADLERATRWYGHLGFVVLAEMGDGPARLVHLRRYRYQDLLLVLRGADEDPPAGAAARTSFSHTGPLDELDAMAAALRGHGAGRVEGPEAMP
jgi:catechol 2,3-dioxygenase-like lactoylglutathione lyase family enzyme